MKKLTFLFLSLVCLLASCTKEPEILTGQIIGLVTEKNSGTTPLSGVQVSIVSTGATTSTGSDGKFSFNGLEAGSYKLQFLKDGYEPDTKTVNVVPGQTANADMQLVAEEKEASIVINPSSLNFGTTQTELSVTIKNEGNEKTDWSLELGNNSWLTASPAAGQIDAGRQQSIVFTVNRDKLSETKMIVVNLAAFGNSFPINISCAPKDAKSYMVVEPSILEFGKELKELDLKVKNTGDALLNWKISDFTEEALSVSENSGKIEPEGSKIVKVFLDREKMAETLTTTLIISDGIKEQSVKITAGFEEQKGEMKVEPLMLDFGAETVELPFTISNTGNAELSWTVSGITEPCISLPQTEGKVAPEGSQVVKVMLDRSQMPDVLNTTLVVSDGKKEETVTIKAEKPRMEMYIETKNLDFAKSESELPLVIQNKGNVEFAWTISGINEKCISVSQASGKIAGGTKATVTVKLDRNQMPDQLNTTFIVSGADKEETITVMAEKDQMAGLVVTQGLYPYYKFDDNYADATENGIHAIGMNTSFIEGVSAWSKAVKFSRAEGSMISVPKPIIDSKTFSVSFWGKDFDEGNIFYMISKYGNTPIFTLSMVQGALKYVVSRYNNIYAFGEMKSFVHPTLSDGNWHHIVLVSDFDKTNYSDTTTRLYIDGQLIDTVVEDGNIFSEKPGSSNATYGTGVKFVMGGKRGEVMDGANMLIDNFRVYPTRMLSDAEIRQIYNAKQ